MEDEELEAISVAGRKVRDSRTHQSYTFECFGISGRLDEFVIDRKGDERCRQLAKVLLEGGSDGVDVKIWIRDVEVVSLDEAVTYDLNLSGAARFAVNPFEVHA